MAARARERTTAADSGTSAQGRTSGDRLVVALVRGIHGLRGAVRVEVLTDHPEERFRPGAVLRPEGSDRPLTIDWARPVEDGPGWRLRFAEIEDRTAAESLKGSYLEADPDPATALERGAYYWHEVIGVPVTATDGTALGTIRDVYRAGGAEVFVVGGGRVGEFDLPAVRAFIRIFAPRRGEIVVDADALDLRLPEEPAPSDAGPPDAKPGAGPPDAAPPDAPSDDA